MKTVDEILEALLGEGGHIYRLVQMDEVWGEFRCPLSLEDYHTLRRRFAEDYREAEVGREYVLAHGRMKDFFTNSGMTRDAAEDWTNRLLAFLASSEPRILFHVDP